MAKNCITLTPCAPDSSLLHGYGYDPETQTIALQFKDWSGGPGSVYHYSNVTQAQYDEFLAAESRGKWFFKNLKHKVKEHPFTKMDRDEEKAAA